MLSQWLRQPQSHWLRRALFQVHLWSGVAIGLYLVMPSVTGSVLVYRIELGRMLAAPRPVYDAKATRLRTNEIRQAAERVYPGWKIVEIGERITRREPTISVSLERGAEKKGRLFNPYTGADLGDSFTRGESWLLWVVNLHDELLFGQEGRFWHGVGSGIATAFVNYISDPNAVGERPADAVLRWLTKLHFGRWREQPWLKAVWAVIGLVPALMVVTGVSMWWNRVVRRRALNRNS